MTDQNVTRTSTDPSASTVVAHATGATHFAAVGAPVPAEARMGVAEQRARVTSRSRQSRPGPLGSVTRSAR